MAAYVRSGPAYKLHTVQIFAVAGERVAHTTVFQDPVVFALFDLPPQR